MKITPLLFALPLAVLLPLRAEDEKKPATESTAESAEKADKPAGDADADWTELESMLKGPSERPKSRDEAIALYKKHISLVDEKAEAFLKAYPSDARRWKLKLHDVQVNGTRGAVGLTAKSDEEIGKILDEILAAKDADEEAKGTASFVKVMQASEDPDKFKELAEAHMKAYPEFEGNRQIQGEMKKAETAKALKSKPIELSFTSTDGREVDLSKMRGKVVLVDFWATWCGPCVAEIPNVVAAYEKLHDKGFEIVGISFDNKKDEEKLAKFTKEKKMPWPQFFDGEGWKNKFGQEYGINSIPAMWLIDKKGMVVDMNARHDLAKKVEKLLAE